MNLAEEEDCSRWPSSSHNTGSAEQMRESTRFANPIAADGDDDSSGDDNDGDEGGMDPTAPDMFDSEESSKQAYVKHAPTSPRLRKSVREGGVFDMEEYLGVVAESLAHLPDEQQESLAPKRADVRILCDGKVFCQFAGKGKFFACWLTLDSTGALTCRDAAGVCDSPEFAGEELRTASILGCAVRTPKTARKKFHPSIRVDFSTTDSEGGKKLILYVAPEDAARSGVTLELLEEAIVSCATKKQNENERRQALAVEQLIERRTILNPDSKFRRRYDMVMILLLVYIAVFVPFRVGFAVPVDVGSFWFFFDSFVDSFFVSDIFVSFRTAYYNDRGELEVSPERISTRYVSGWFIIDTASCFPGNYIANAIDDGRKPHMVKILGITRMLKLLRLARFGRLIARYEVEFHSFMTRIKLGKLVLVMGLLGHWLCCTWFAFGSLRSDELDQNGERVLGWVARTWGEDGVSLSSATTADYYARSFYWAIMTMTTVGYGDIVPQTGYETIIAIIGMLIGGFVFGLIIGNLGELSKQQNPGDVIRQQRFGLVGAMLHQGAAKVVDAALGRQIRAYYDYSFYRRTAMDVRSLVLECPPQLRNTLAGQLRWVDGDERGLLDKVPFLSGLDTVSSIEICARMRSIQAIPMVMEVDGSRSNLIMREGQSDCEEMCTLRTVLYCTVLRSRYQLRLVSRESSLRLSLTHAYFWLAFGCGRYHHRGGEQWQHHRIGEC